MTDEMFPKFFPSTHVTVLSASSPVYTFNGNIDLIVRFAHLGDVDAPFTATPTGSEHGVWLFNQAKAGAFGVVQPYVVSPAEMLMRVQYLTDEATAKINAIQVEVDTLQDAVDLEMATEEEVARLAAAKAELTAWKRYRVLLSRVPAQPGFPADITWPVKPA